MLNTLGVKLGAGGNAEADGITLEGPLAGEPRGLGHCLCCKLRQQMSTTSAEAWLQASNKDVFWEVFSVRQGACGASLVLQGQWACAHGLDLRTAMLEKSRAGANSVGGVSESADFCAFVAQRATAVGGMVPLAPTCCSHIQADVLFTVEEKRESSSKR